MIFVQKSLPRAWIAILPKYIVLICCLHFLIGTAYAGGVPDDGALASTPESIDVSGHAIDSKQYRKLWAALEIFDKHKSLAPDAVLHFRLLALRPDATLDGARLTVVGNARDVAIPIDADGRFAIPRDQEMYDDDAQVVLNRKEDQFGWAPDVQTPGLPANARRLGDLRLQCEVGDAADVKSTGVPIPLVTRPNIALHGGYCYGGLGLAQLFPGPPGASGVILVYGEKRKPLTHVKSTMAFSVTNGSNFDGPGWYETSFNMLVFRRDYLVNGEYTPPLRDRDWPDDTLVEFEQTAVPVTEHAGAVAAATADVTHQTAKDTQENQ